MMNLGLSVDAVIDIAKTVPTLVLELPDGQMITRTIFNTRDQQLIRPLFPNSCFGCPIVEVRRHLYYVLNRDDYSLFVARLYSRSLMMPKR